MYVGILCYNVTIQCYFLDYESILGGSIEVFYSCLKLKPQRNIWKIHKLWVSLKFSTENENVFNLNLAEI